VTCNPQALYAGFGNLTDGQRQRKALLYRSQAEGHRIRLGAILTPQENFTGSFKDAGPLPRKMVSNTIEGRKNVMNRKNQLIWSLKWIVLLGGSLAAVLATGGQKPSFSGAGGWRLGDPVTYENLTVFPILASKTADTSGFTTLDEALGSGDAVVSESGSEAIRRSRDGRPYKIPVQSSATVNQLVLINRGSKPLILLAGELVSGGKQDRIISKDRIVPPDAEPLPLDVFCVEQGRWSSGTQFSAAKLMVHPSVREKAVADQEQSKVWAAVRKGSTSSGGVTGAGTFPSPTPALPPPLSSQELDRVVTSEAPTQSYKGIYKSSRVENSVEPFAEELRRRFARATVNLKGESVVGVVVAYGRELAWSDAFASATLFERYWPKLLRSYVVEALARPRTTERPSIDDAREFLQPLAGHENIESEPGIYSLRQVFENHYVEVELEALRPSKMLLHTLKIHRTS
jgi:hypothetical protein